MSEYLNKKAVLEWFGLMHLENHNAAVLEFIESGIEILESGAFDVTEVDSEVQRLRAALEDIRYQVQQSDHPAGVVGVNKCYRQ